eukprot:gene13580-10254_t
MMLAMTISLVTAVLNGPPAYNCTTQPADAYTPIVLKNSHLEARFQRYGATLTHLIVPDANGNSRDIALGWDDGDQYCSNPSHTYFGATIGRFANRIANGTFKIDGKTYHTPLNDHGIDTLHGGWVGYDRRYWTVVKQTDSMVKFNLVSPDGEMGFPGTLHINVTHELTEDNEWVLTYEGEADAHSVLAMTNHVYFNLNANVDNTPTVLEHILEIKASKFLPVDSTLIPTGAIGSVSNPANAYLDFRGKDKKIGADINKGTVTPLGGYDNAWIFDNWTPGKMLNDVARLSSPLTKIAVSMSTDQPSVQFYSGNFLNGTDPASRIQRKKSQSFGSEPQYYQWRGAATLEAQQFPDAPNHPNFPPTDIMPGKPYFQQTKYRIGIYK